KLDTELDAIKGGGEFHRALEIVLVTLHIRRRRVSKTDAQRLRRIHHQLPGEGDPAGDRRLAQVARRLAINRALPEQARTGVIHFQLTLAEVAGQFFKTDQSLDRFLQRGAGENRVTEYLIGARFDVTADFETEAGV